MQLNGILNTVQNLFVGVALRVIRLQFGTESEMAFNDDGETVMLHECSIDFRALDSFTEK